jgi:hypothetical protein
MIRVLVVALALLEAGWMTYDGGRALVVGAYVTPSSGAHAGRLGPWSKAVRAVGVEPRSTGMKVFFVVYGVLWLAVAAGYAGGWDGVGAVTPGRLLLALAVGSLWYAPVGTVLGLAQAALLLWRG